MTEHYNQPFYVPISKRHLFPCLHGRAYLPPIEPPLEITPEKTEPPEPEWRQVQWNLVRQLENKVLFLQKKIVELQNIRNKKSKETMTGIIPME